MALIQVNYLSRALFRTVPLHVVLPVDKISFADLRYQMKPGAKFKTLYLLHGLLGNYTDWVSGTRIQRWAEEKNLAVVMPSGDNSYYINSMLPNNRYEEFIAQELPEITRNMFLLSDRREDTFIAGLSMGGYGAVRIGMKYADRFSHIIGLSSGLRSLAPEYVPMAGENRVFGDIDEARKTDLNHLVAYADLQRRVRAGECAMPAFYLACGTRDSLLPYNRAFRDLLLKDGVPVAYDEEDRGHDWDFWDSQIKKALDWLPLSGGAGLGSGNVRKQEP